MRSLVRTAFVAYKMDSMHLGIAALIAALVGALADAGMLLCRTPALRPFAFTSAASDGLLVFAALGLALGAAAAIAGRVPGAERAARAAGRPVLAIVDLWNGTRKGEPDTSAGASAPWIWLAGKAAALATLAWVIHFTIEGFHEPFRIAVAAACIGLPAAALAELVVRRATGAVADLAGRLVPPSRGKAARRASLTLLAAPLAALLVWLVAARERLFGAFDPGALGVLAISATAGSATCALAFLARSRGGAGGFARPWRVIVAGAAALVVGTLLLSVSPASRQAVAANGSLGREILSGLTALLDPDRDRSAWLIGDDCHPLDRRANPLATERPGNGYDENCDGSDRAVPRFTVADPLADLAAPPRLVRRNGSVLIVLIDAAARDRLSLFGASRATTPSLRKFAERGAVFDNFFAASNHTALSMPALLTGLPPSSFHGALKRSFAAVQLSSAQLGRSIQRRLSAEGYETRMLAGHRMGGFTRGFDELEKPRNKGRTPAGRLTDSLVGALREIETRHEEPALVFAHYMDAHHPYDAASSPTRFGGGSRDRYDAELRYVDDHLSRALSLMDEDGFRDWLVVVTSDHGEAFGEHRTRYHGESLYDEEIRVPLVLRVPGAAPRRVATPASHLDILPTILEWAGLPADPALPGRSLIGLAAAPADPEGRRVVFTEFFRKGVQVSAHDGRWSFSYNVETDVRELYDRETDPGQRDNLYGSREDTELEAALLAHAASTMRRLEENARPPVEPPKRASRRRDRSGPPPVPPAAEPGSE